MGFREVKRVRELFWGAMQYRFAATRPNSELWEHACRCKSSLQIVDYGTALMVGLNKHFHRNGARPGLQVTGYGLRVKVSRPDKGCHCWQRNYQEFWYACTCNKAV